MKVLQQAWRVALKDVTVAWRWLAVWALVCAAQLFLALRLGWDTADLLNPSLIIAAALLLTAFLVQQDPVQDANAFWVTRPISAAGMWLGKLMSVAVIVVAPALLAQSLALAAYDADVATYVRVLIASGILLAFWLALAMVVAASTRNMSTFATALLVMVAVSTTAVIWYYSGRRTATMTPLDQGVLHPAHPLWRIALPLLLLALVAWLYHKRLQIKPVIGLAIAFALLILASAGWSTQSRFDFTPSPGDDAVTLHARFVERSALSGNASLRMVEVQLPPLDMSDERHLLLPLQAYIEASDRRREPVGIVPINSVNVAIAASSSAQPAVATSQQPASTAHILPGDTGASAPDAVGPHSNRVVVTLNERQAQRLDEGDARLVILGELYRETLRELPALQPRGGEAASAGGSRARIAVWNTATGSGEVVIASANLPLKRITDGAFAFALVAGGIEWPLRAHHVSARSGGLVLPGGRPSVARYALELDEAASEAGPPPNATLTVRLWQPLERTPVSMTIAP